MSQSAPSAQSVVASSGGVGIALATVAAAAVVFEQSPANEALRANLAFRALDYSGNPIVVGFVVFGLTIVIEGVAALAVMAGMRANPVAMDKLSARFGRSDRDEKKRSRSSPSLFSFTDIGIALGIGAAIVVLKRALSRTPDHLYWRHLAGAAGAATAVVAVVSGLIGYLVAGGVETAAKYGLETPADYIVRYGASWRFWLLTIGGAQLLSWIYNRAIKYQATKYKATKPGDPSPATISLGATGRIAPSTIPSSAAESGARFAPGGGRYLPHRVFDTLQRFTDSATRGADQERLLDLTEKLVIDLTVETRHGGRRTAATAPNHKALIETAILTSGLYPTHDTERIGREISKLIAP